MYQYAVRILELNNSLLSINIENLGILLKSVRMLNLIKINISNKIVL